MLTSRQRRLENRVADSEIAKWREKRVEIRLKV